ncbi:MAG: methyltransferase domain-containing protein [Thermoanaerobaculia bacterium]
MRNLTERPRRRWTSYAKIQGQIGHLLRNHRFQLRRERIRGLRYLDIGCGWNVHDHLINMDYLWHPAVDLCWDIRRGLPFENGSLKGIFSEHCLEHFSISTVEKILSECRRVLAPGGTLRIVVPDTERYLRVYVRQCDADSAERFPFQEQEALRGRFVPMLSVNRVFYQDRDSPAGHRTMFDFPFLDLLLQEAGFRAAVKRSFREGRDPALLVDCESRAVESLYVEATVTTDGVE